MLAKIGNIRPPSAPASLMRPLTPIIALLICATLSLASAEPLVAPNAVDIPSGSNILRAQLYKPDGKGPFPTVIALHGCGGLAGRSEPVLARYREWAEDLVKDGKAVLLPDSYGSRGPPPQTPRHGPGINGRAA